MFPSMYVYYIAPRAGKMNQIPRCDWLPARGRWSYLALSELPALSRKKNFPKSHIINPSLTKLARSRWIFWLVVNNLVGYCLHVKFTTRIICILRNSAYVLSKLIPTQAIRPWANGKCLATKHHQTLFGDQKFYRLDTLFWCCLVVFDKI